MDIAGSNQGVSGVKNNPIFNPAIGLSGFGFLLAWHFIILFNPMHPVGSAVESEFMLVRQVAINASLCVFFIVGGKLLSKLPPRDRIESHRHLYVAMVAGAIGTLGLMFFSHMGLYVVVASVTLAGAAEATMMLLWLRFYAETSTNYSGQTLGISALLASLIAFFTFHMTFSIVIVVSVLLPVISGVALIVTTRGIPLRHNDLSGASITDWDTAKRPFWKTTVQLMTMSLFFGLIQGCYSPGDMLLPMTNPFSILGAAFAGVMIFVIYSRTEFLPRLSPLINGSIVMFLAGVLLVPFRNEILSGVAAFLVMTGFIIYFLLALVMIIDLVRTFDLNLTIALGANQALEYLMFTVGIVAGYYLWGSLGGDFRLAFAITSACSIVLIAVVLAFSTERPPWDAAYYKANVAKKVAACEESDVDDDEPDVQSVEAAAMASIVATYGLTPREIDVFELLSRGRNAEYIQNWLVISNHTVKTHIYNIYRKLDVHSLQELLDLVDSEKEGHHT